MRRRRGDERLCLAEFFLDFDVECVLCGEDVAGGDADGVVCEKTGAPSQSMAAIKTKNKFERRKPTAFHYRALSLKI
jgi:hypothetical protein